jgi:hypothetical protein
MFLVPFSLTSNPESLTLSKMALILNFIIPKTYLYQRREVVQAITGQVGILKGKKFNNKLWI